MPPPPNNPNPKQQKIQQAVQKTAQDARQQAGQTGGPELQKRLGQSLDFSKGVDLGAAAPHYGGAAPPLPNPGESIPAPPTVGHGGFIPPGVIPNPAQLEQLAAQGALLPDDHDAVVGANGPGPGQRVPVQRFAPQRPVHTAPKKPEHPVLTQLKIDLGIESIEPIDVRVGGHVWTMKVMSEQDVAISARIADMMAQTQSDHVLKLNTAIVSAAIIAIDGHPVWEVMGLEVPPDTLPLSNPLMPPEETRRLGVIKLYEWIAQGTKTQLSAKLYEAYVAKVDPHGQVKSQLEDPNNPRFKFVCTTKDCKNDLIDTPVYEQGTRNIMPYFCKFHGTVMEVVGKLGEDGELGPLD